MTQMAAGWYPDPEMAGTVRYWDGAAWTESAAPAPTQAPAGTISPVHAYRAISRLLAILGVLAMFGGIGLGFVASEAVSMFFLVGGFLSVGVGVLVWVLRPRVQRAG
ncbi:DUF2510 domain-containing protein [Rhodococcus rhodnii]|nr:DUF2510 domain-containing protein [Rhodococcus rhodnii]TXG88287.1 DUF2510 domain-containing protein [Rhodococcus rhodnii]TXG92273.1 DUF2510 domain-containing protein [Rhodococcus rhodnii]